jgi:hypothetical protein
MAQIREHLGARTIEKAIEPSTVNHLSLMVGHVFVQLHYCHGGPSVTENETRKKRIEWKIRVGKKTSRKQGKL